MDGMLRNAERCRGLFEQFYLPGLPDRWSQSQANNFFLFAAPETSHQQDAFTNTGFAKRNCLIQRGHAEPARALLLQRLRALDRAVPVGIGFHDGTNRHPGAYVLLHYAKVSPQRSQRDLSPSRSSRGSLGNFDGSHWL